MKIVQNIAFLKNDFFFLNKREKNIMTFFCET